MGEAMKTRTIRTLLLAASLLLLSAARMAAQEIAAEALTISGDYTADFLADRDQVTILRLTGNYDRNLPGGTGNAEPRMLLAREFYKQHPDSFDFLVTFTTFPVGLGDAVGLHWSVRNDVQGIGLDQFDNSSAFGSDGRLQGFIDMGPLASHADDPFDPAFEETLNVLTHEILHQWAAHVRFQRPGEPESDGLLGRDGSHWSFLLDSGASVLYGNQWHDNGDGTFTTDGGMKFYSPLDLYLAGFLAADEVPPFVLIDSPGFDRSRLPERGVTVTGTAIQVTIQDVIAAEGHRVPSAAESQKELRAAFLLVTRPGETVPQAQIEALDRIRRALVTRFAVLTGGRGILHVYPESLPGEPGEPGPVEGGGLRGVQANVADALAWLRLQQGADGSWQDTAGTRSRDSASVLATLTAFDVVFAPADRRKSAAWLAAQTPPNTDGVARLATALQAASEAEPLTAQKEAAAAAAATFRGRLRERQNADGGWGLGAGYGSDPLDTALAVLALASKNDSPPTVLDRAGQYLLANQGADGGWSNVARGASRTGATVASLRGLKALGRQAAVADAAVTFLAARQNGDGGFGDSPSTAHDTANVLQTVVELGVADRIRLSDALGYLTGRQTVSGSWEGSTYTTAAVVSALRRQGAFPNWRFSTPPAASPAQPRDGERVTLTLTVRNEGQAAAPAGILRLYDGDPAATPAGTPAGDFQLPAMPPGSSVVVSPVWDSSDKPGPHTLWAVIDPDGETDEMTKLDNRTSLRVEVQPAPAGTELEVRAVDVAFLPAQPATLPVQLGISVTVRNVGQAAAPEVAVQLWRGPAQTGELIGEATISVPGRDNGVANFLYDLATAGTTTFTVVVDPDGAIAEADETNNSATASVTTRSAVDLAVTDLEAAGPVFLGVDATIAATFHNRGTTDSPLVSVRFSVSQGTTVRELGARTVQLNAGQSLTQSVVWRVDLEGELVFKAEIDTASQVAEADETNNSAVLPLTSGQIPDANLVVSHEDLTFSPNPAREGRPLTLTAVVRNPGGQAVANAEVAFYEGDPAQGAARIGDVQVIPGLAAGASATVSLTWPRVPDANDRTIHVKADPAGKVAEFREDDNVAFNVLEFVRLPDAAVSAASLRLEPGVPVPGQPVTLFVTVANLGEQEIENLVLRAFDGDPDQVGTAVGGDQVIPLLAAQGSAQASFTWTFAAGSARPVVIVADPDGAVEETSEGNNSARIEVSAQDGDAFVTNRYFSPNGDGVKDTTRFFFRLAGVADVAVEIVDERGRVVRRHEGPELLGIESGSFEWDGRNDRGQVARDGDYSLRALGAGGQQLAAAVAALDTDRWPLLRALGTPYVSFPNLTCDVPDLDFDELVSSDDEQWLFFHLDDSSPGYPRGVYRMTEAGAEVGRVLLDSTYSSVTVSPDGSTLAFTRQGEPGLWAANPDGSALRQVWDGNSLWQGFTADGRSLIGVATDRIAKTPISGDDPDQAPTLFEAQPGFDINDPHFSPDRRSVIFVPVSQNDYWYRNLQLLDVESGQVVTLADPVSPEDRFSWSPDSSRMALALIVPESGVLRIVDSAGNLVRELPIPIQPFATVPEYKIDGEEPAELRQPDFYAVGEPAWSDSGTELALRVIYRESSTSFGRILRFDLTTGEAETVTWLKPGSIADAATAMTRAAVAASTLDEIDSLPSWNRFGSSRDLVWTPFDRTLVYQSGEDTPLAIFLDEGNRMQRIPGGSFEGTDVSLFSREPTFSPAGKRLFFHSKRDAEDPQSACFERGNDDLYAFDSLLNLTATLRPRRSATQGGILLEGSAADLHFARSTLEYASVSAPAVWRPIAPPSSTPVVDGRFGTWVPPGPGSYLVRLTVEDQAGNVRRRIKRISSADTPALTDLYTEPAYISPNGDGVQDQMVLHYRVLEPVHLEISIYDEDGDRVRTLRRDHSLVGAEFEVPWDGRDDRGLAVPDGEYRLTIQSYEFFVIVDSTPPTVSARLDISSSCVDFKTSLQAGLFYSYSDENVDDLLFESGEGFSPAVWSPVSLPAGPGSMPLPIDFFVNRSYRLEVSDLAGNRTRVTRPPGDERVIMREFGDHLADAQGELRLLGDVCGLSPSVFEKRTKRLMVTEAVRAPIKALSMQFQPVPKSNILQPGEWLNSPAQLFATGPNGKVEILWELEKVPTGVPVAARLLLIDDADGAHLSGHFRFSLEGIELSGLLSLKLLQDLPDQQVANTLSDLLAQAGLDPDETPVLWGRELINEPLESLRIIAESSTDPRYSVPREIPVTATAANGIFIANAADWRACNKYLAKAVARTVARPIPRTLESNKFGHERECVGLELEWEPIQVGSCNAPRISSRRILRITPKSMDGKALQILTVSGADENGQPGVLFSVNRPQSGTTYEYIVESLNRPEGMLRFDVRVTNVDGQERRASRSVAIDNTPPELTINYPLEGQRVCGIARGNKKVVDVLARIADASGFATRLEASGSSNPQSTAIAPEAGDGVLAIVDGKATEHFSSGSSGRTETQFFKTLTNLVGTLSDRAEEVTAHLEVVDNGGFRLCTDTTFYFDALLEGGAGTIDRKVFSPNGDGLFDEAAISFRAAEPSTVDVDVVPATPHPLDRNACVQSGAPVRSLVSGVPVLEGGTTTWDGLTDGGTVAPDGLYMVLITQRDACGNVGRVESLCTMVDNTPPELAISYPRPGDPLPMVIEVKGSIHDPHIESWFLEFGEGPEPLSWGSLSLGANNRSSTVDPLALWNTFGLSGEYALRLRASDSVANRAETRVQTVMALTSELITYLEAGPRPFSPNGDGRREEAAVRFGLAHPSRVDLVILDADGDVVQHILQDVPLPAGAAIKTWDGAAAADGTWRVQLLARLASNPLVTQREEVTVQLDRTPPALSLARPNTPFVRGGGPITGSIQDANLAELTLSLTGTPLEPAWEEIFRDTRELTDAVLGNLEGLEEGDYALRLGAMDKGEIASEIVVPFTVDNTPPVVSLSAPLADAMLGKAGGPVPVLGQIEELHVASWRLEVGLGDAPSAWTSLATGTTLPLPQPVHAWVLDSMADGRYTLRLAAEDQAGHLAEARVKITVDNTPPAVALTAPPEGGFVTGPMAVTGTVTDAHLLEYRLAVAVGLSTAFSDLGGGSAAVTNGELFQWLALPPDGEASLRLRATDAAGNQAETTVRITVDVLPPAAPALTAVLENRRDARLTWTANTEPDLAGYFVYRDGVKINAQPLATPGYVDLGLGEGSYVYKVRAVDRAGQESDPSNPATVNVDITPPDAILQRPANGSKVSGLVDVTGTAWSLSDFKEYRLYVGPGDGSSGRQLLRASPVPLRGAVLAQWDTSVLPEGAEYTLRLEAEDLAGNIAVQLSRVTVDNLPPSAPTGLAATASGTTANVTWNANPEPDVRGYLLYRDGRLANAGGAPVIELDPFILAATAYANTGMPDGTFTYEVYAIDHAGNLSGPSASVQVTLDNRAPAAQIVQPADGAQVEGTVYVQAATPDTDIARVLFQWKALADPAWTDIGAADTAAPWEINWETEALAYGEYQLRAVATDQGNRTDPAPLPVTVTLADLTQPPAVLGLTALVDGGDVHLTWTEATEPVAGYHVDRIGVSGDTLRLTTDPVTEASYDDTGLSDDTWRYVVVAVDQAGNESDPSQEREAVVYTPVLEQPYTPTIETSIGIAGKGIGAAEVLGDVARGSGTTPLPAATADAEGRFALAGLALEPEANTFTVRLHDTAGNRSKPASVRVVADTAPSAPTGLAAVPPPAYQVDLTWNPNPEADILGYRPFRDGEPLLADAPATDLTAASGAENAVDGDPGTLAGVGEGIEISWPEPRIVAEVSLLWEEFPYTPADYDLEAWDGIAWVAVAKVRGNVAVENALRLARPYRTDRLRLTVLDSPDFYLYELGVIVQPYVTATAWTDTAPDGVRSYTVTALDLSGFESAPSVAEEVEVGNFEPPLPVELSGSVAGSDAHLEWTASASDDVDRYDLYRDGVRVATVSPGLTYDDEALPNGTYRYVVRPVDIVGNAGQPSNQVELVIAVAPPPAPVGLAVTAVAAGRALDLVWTPGAGTAPESWRVQRGSSAGGPYETIANVPVGTTTYRDSGLTNGQTYWYVVAALDAAGNASAVSNEASGVPADTTPPAAPALYHPTLPGFPFTTGEASITVAGSAEPGATVTLRRGLDALAATALAEPSTAVATASSSGVPWPSPDGRYLWMRSGVTSVYDFATGLHTLALPVREDARWFADSSGVVFTDGTSIRSYRIADGQVRDLAQTEYAVIAVPSPDGQRLAVTGIHDGQDGLWSLDLESGSWTLLDASGFSQILSGSLTWSPDGSSLAFIRFGPDEILVIDAGTGAAITADSQPGDSTPDWSPDGSELLFTSFESGSEQVWRFRPADGSRQQVTSEPGEHRGPQWSPDGTAVAWIRDREDLFVQPLAGGEPSPLGNAEGATLGWVGGHFVLARSFGTERITPAGHVELHSVTLEHGENRFTAVARDEAGNDSAPSAEILVKRGTSEQPDLAVSDSGVTLLPGILVSGATARATAVVSNLGSVDAPAVELSFAVVRPDGPPVIVADRVAVGALAAGASRAVSADFTLTGVTGSYTLVAAVDPTGAIEESSESNNSGERPFKLLEDASPALFAATDQPVYAVGEEVRITVEAVNGGPAFTGRIEIAIEDAAGFLVENLPGFDVTVPSGGSLLREAVWTPVDVLAGAYRVHARLGNVAEATAAFTLGSSAQVTAELAADRATYVIGSTARLTGSVAYRAGNEALTGVVALIQVLPEAGGSPVAEFTRTLGDLLPGAGGSVTADWLTTGAVAGAYRARIEVRQGERVLATAETRFDLAAQAPRVTGTLTLSSRTPAWGSPVTATLSVRLTGGAALSQVPVRVVVLDPVQSAVLATQPFQLDLPVSGAAVQRTASFDTSVLGLGGRLAVLEADVNGQTVTLDVESLTVLDLTPPTVAIDQPLANASTDPDVEVVVTARDSLSPLGQAEVSLDGGAWLRMSVRDAANGRFARSFADLAEGEHRLKARAADAWGNVAETAEITFTVNVAADPVLAATKADALVVDPDDNDQPSPGDTLEYTIVVRNTGSAPATDIVVLDPVPTHTSVVAGSVTTTMGTVESENPPRVALGELAPGAEATITFRVTIASPLPAGISQVVNQATVTSADLPAVFSDDLDLGGAADPTATAITASPRLVAEKTDRLAVDADGDEQPSPGDTVEYTIVIRNTGNSEATGVAFNDPVPTHTTLVSGSNQSTIGSLAGGASATVIFEVRIDSVVPAGVNQISNQGTVTSNELADVLTDDPDATGAANPTVTPITAAPRLTVTKTDVLFEDGDIDGTASPGDALLYQITMANDGNTSATGVELSDLIPAHTAIEAGSVQTSQGAVVSEDPVEVEVGEIVAGANATVSFRVRIDSTVPAGVLAISNQAAIASTELPAILSDDPDMGGDTDPTVTPIATAPRLSAEKTDALALDADGNGSPSPGDTIEYTIVLRNSGNTPATGVLIHDLMPARTSAVAGSASTTLGTVESETPLRVSMAELAAGGEATVVFRAIVDPTVTAGTLEVSNQASIMSNELPAVLSDDPDAGGDADPTVTAITAAPRLVAEKTALLAVDADSDGSPSPGDTLEYSLTIRNLGNTGATGVALADEIPALTTVVPGSVIASAGSVESESPVEVSIGTLDAGATVSVSFRVTVSNPFPGALRTVVNQGTVTSAELPAVLTDDPAVAGIADPTVTAVTAAPRLAVIKTDVLFEDADGDGTASPHDALLYQVTVTNSGNTTATGLLLEDPIPANTAIILDTVQASQGVVLNESPVVVDLGDLAAGASATVSFRVRIDSPIPPDVIAVSNQATVTNIELPQVLSDDPETPQADDPTATPIVITPAIAIGGAIVDEDAGEAVLAVTLSTPSNQVIEVEYSTEDGTATAGMDYTSVAGTLTFAPGETAKTVTVAILDDTLDEDDETFTVTLSGVQGNAVLAVAEGLGTIRDDDDPPSLAIGNIGDIAVLEGNGPALVPVTLSTATSRDVRVSWATVAGGTAQPGADYSEGTGPVIIPAGSLVGTISVEILPDLLDEADETFHVSLSAPVGAVIIDPEATVTITDDDPLPSLSVADVTVTEGTGLQTSAVFTVALNAPSGRVVSVQHATTAGTAQAVLDYLPAVPDTLTFPAGTTSLTVTVPIVGDNLPESTETFSLVLSQAQNAALADAVAIATVEDDDGVPVLSISDASVQEGDSGTVSAELTLTLNAPSGSAVTVQYATEDGTANEEDYVPASGPTATIPAGSLSTTVTIQVSGDEENETDETFLVRLSSPVGATLGKAEGTVTILDDDLPRLSVLDLRVTEGNAGTTNALVTVELDGPSAAVVQVDFATEDVTAVAGRDYQAVSDTLTFSPGQTSATITVRVIGDLLLEASEETFDVLLSAPVAAEIERGRAEVVIEDNEVCASPNLLSNPGAEELPGTNDPIPGWAETEGTGWRRKTSNPNPAEGAAYFFAGNAQNAELVQDVNVSGYAAHILTGAQELELQASLRTFGESPSDTARVVLEFRDPANLVVLDAWDSGDIASPGAWQRVTHRRTAPAGTGWIRVRLISTRHNSGADGANDGYFDAVSLRSLRAATLSIGDALAYEGPVGTTTNAVFPVTLSCPVESEVSVRYATADGTALAGSDYLASQGVVTFPSGQVSSTVTVPVLGDEEHELHESFTVNLTEPAPQAPPSGIVIVDPRGVGAIVNDDFCPRSPGFWKNHTEVWPASSLVLGNIQYNSAQLLTLLNYKGSNTSSHLARQLVASKLNLLVGSPVFIVPTVNAADLFLAAYPPGSNPPSADKQRGEVLKNQLDAYNNMGCQEDQVIP
jgi:large repetitive protein